MENAVHAIKMAFAVLVFVAALSLAVYSFNRVRQTSANLAQNADIKEYYQQLALDATGEGSVNALSSRIVGPETIIPTLYRYYKENYTILFYVGTGYDRTTGNFATIEPMTLYYTETDATYLPGSTITTTEAGSQTRKVYGFDIQDEQVRREPWSATQKTSFEFIKAFVNGTLTEKYYTSRTASLYNGTINQFTYNPPDEPYPYYQIKFQYGSFNGGSDGIIGKDYEFVERYGEYNYNNVQNVNEDDEGNSESQLNILSNIVDAVDELDNGEIVANNKGTTKRVIQYIYIKSEA